jgi:hypothetical protein
LETPLTEEEEEEEEEEKNYKRNARGQKDGQKDQHHATTTIGKTTQRTCFF